MSSSTNMNVVLSQGNAVREMQSVRHQAVELNQLVVAQDHLKKTEDKKNQVQKSENAEQVRTDKDKAGRSKQDEKKEGKGRSPGENKAQQTNDHLVDIVA